MEILRTVTREFMTGDKAVLHLESRSGSVTVEGRQSDRVVVDAVVRVYSDISAEADEAAALVARGMEQDGHRVIVRAPALRRAEAGWAVLLGHRGSRIDYHVRVPRKTAVRVLSQSGSVQILHTEGVVHTEARSGKLGIEDITGNVTVVARSGSVQIEDVRGDVTVEARSGRLRVRRVQGGVQTDSRSGSVEVEGVAGTARIIASAGSVSASDVEGKLLIRSRAGSVRYRGRILQDADIEAHAGSITLAVDPDFPFFIDAESSVGSVRSDLPPRRGNGAPPEGGPKVRLRSHAGSIRLTRAD